MLINVTNDVFLSQSPEGAMADCDCKSRGSRTRCALRLNPPKGRRPIATPSVPHSISTEAGMSQSPEGATADCDARLVQSTGITRPDVSIPRRVNGRLRPDLPFEPRLDLELECLNPPKGRRPIATLGHLSPRLERLLIMSQSPEGSTANCDSNKTRRYEIRSNVSIPRRGDGQVRQGCDLRHGRSRTVLSQSPEGSTADCDEIVDIQKDESSCLNPPKGRRPIATGGDALALTIAMVAVSQSPEGSTANCDRAEWPPHSCLSNDVSITRRVDGQLRPEL